MSERKSSIIVLEDNVGRLQAITVAIRSSRPVYEITCFDNAPDFIANIDELLPQAVLISLDHDLGPARGGVDPGDGRDVARALAQRTPTCPVIIHSTNVTGAAGMKFDLEDAGWPVTLISPYGDLEWIESAWLPTVRELLDT